MAKNNKKLLIAGIIVIIALIIIALQDTSTIPKVAKFETVSLQTPNFGTNNLKVEQIATITVNVKNISNSTISDVYVKTTPKFSEDGEFVKILDNEKKISPDIGGGGTSGPIKINIKGMKIPTKDATEIILVELFVNNQSQEIREIEINMIR